MTKGSTQLEKKENLVSSCGNTFLIIQQVTVGRFYLPGAKREIVEVPPEIKRSQSVVSINVTYP
jgi:hypothetical protein